MAYSAEFAEFVKELLGGLGPVTVRRMFGGAGVYCDGVMFGLIARDTLYFRVDNGNRPAFEAEGMEPFSYEGKGKPIQLPYWRLPERLFDEADETLEWARSAVAAAQRASTKPKRAENAGARDSVRGRKRVPSK